MPSSESRRMRQVSADMEVAWSDPKVENHDPKPPGNPELPCALDPGEDDVVVYIEDDSGGPSHVVTGPRDLPTDLDARSSETRELLVSAVQHTEAALIDVSLAGQRPELIQSYLTIIAELHALRDGRTPSGALRVKQEQRSARGRMDALPDEPAAVCQFTPRQMAVFELLKTGASTRKIAGALGMAEGTVKMHLAAIYRTMRVHSRAEAIAKAS